MFLAQWFRKLRVDMGLRHSSCSVGAGRRDSLPRLAPMPKHAVRASGLGSAVARAGSSPRERKRTRRMDRRSAIIEVEIDGVTVRVGRGAEAKTVAAVLRGLKAGA